VEEANGHPTASYRGDVVWRLHSTGQLQLQLQRRCTDIQCPFAVTQSPAFYLHPVGRLRCERARENTKRCVYKQLSCFTCVFGSVDKG
jgi:hypothetical protein